MRELGTLKALGWKQRLVVRQVVGESLTQGAAGGLLGVALGVLGALAVGAFGVTLSAHTLGRRRVRLRRARAHGERQRSSSTRRCRSEILVAGFLLALIGGLLAGAAGAFRAARLRPADALRAVE